MQAIMHTVKDSLLVLGRIYTIYPLLLAVTLFMGRRSIGQLPVFDFLIFLSLGAVVGADIADPQVEHIHTAVAVVLLGVLQRLFAYLVVKYRKFGKLVTFEPVIVIKDGLFMQRSLKKLQYSIDDILGMLREQQIFDTSTVHLAVLEGNGMLSVLKQAGSQEATLAHLGISGATVGISYPVIKEGLAQAAVLEKLDLDELWLSEKLKERGLIIQDVFFATLNERGELTVTVYGPEPATPPLYH